MKTTTTKAKNIKRSWHQLDVKGQVLGRISTKIVFFLQGKNKPYFTTHLDCGDFVVITNTDKIAVTGRKAKDKIYYHHTNYPSGLRSIPFEDLLKKDSRKIIYRAVKNMLPKNKLRDQRLRRLKLFKGAKHTYQDKFKKEK